MEIKEKEKKKTEDIFFIVIFILIISAFLMFLPYMYFEGIKSKAEERGNIRLNTDYTGQRFSSIKNFSDKITVGTENLLLDRFPLYDEINDAVSDIENAVDNIFYKDLDFVPVSLNSNVYYYINEKRGRFVRLLNYDGEDMENQLKIAADYYNKVYEELQPLGINMYIYAIPLSWNSKEGENNLYPYDEYEQFENFKKSLDDEIAADLLYIEDIDEFDKYFFKTDHHWNSIGAYQGYLDMVELLESKNGDLGQKVQITGKRIIEGLQSRGSMARVCLIDRFYDEWKVLDTNIDEYEIYLNDAIPDENFSQKDKYDSGEFPTDTYAAHYGNYYHSDYAKLQYIFKNNTGKNLLFIADSNSNSMEMYLASHFDNTYVIDIRMYAEFCGNEQWLSEFVEKNDITDVLILSSTNGIWRSYIDKLGDKAE